MKRLVFQKQKAKGINPKDKVGRAKPALHLIPPPALCYLAAVMDHGAGKYGAYNWRTTPVQVSTYIGAALRHILRYWDGEDLDADSGLPHLAHAAACMAILLDGWSCRCLYDDRPPSGDAGRVIEALARGRRQRGTHVMWDLDTLRKLSARAAKKWELKQRASQDVGATQSATARRIVEAQRKLARHRAQRSGSEER